MSPDQLEENQIPIRKSSNSQSGNFDPPAKKWRIVDLAESQGQGAGAKKEYNANYKRKSKLSLGAIAGGVFNLLLVFGLGAVIYFGWVYYKNNYSGTLPFGENKKAPAGNEWDGQDPEKDLKERVEEIKNLISPDSATTTDLPGVTEKPKMFLKVSDNRVGYLNIRNTPSLSGQIIGKAKPRDTYEYIEVSDSWYKILLENSSEGAPSEGWVHGDYIKVIKEETVDNKDGVQTQSATSTANSAISTTSQAQKLIKVTSTPTGYLNVRNSPWGTIIGKVYPGEEYVYTDSKDNWYFLNVTDKDGKDVSGWVFGNYVEKL